MMLPPTPPRWMDGGRWWCHLVRLCLSIPTGCTSSSANGQSCDLLKLVVELVESPSPQAAGNNHILAYWEWCHLFSRNLGFGWLIRTKSKTARINNNNQQHKLPTIDHHHEDVHLRRRPLHDGSCHQIMPRVEHRTSRCIIIINNNNIGISASFFSSHRFVVGLIGINFSRGPTLGHRRAILVIIID